MKKRALAAVAPGGSVGWLSTGDCMTSGDVGSILDFLVSKLFGGYRYHAECRLHHQCQYCNTKISDPGTGMLATSFAQ